MMSFLVLGQIPGTQIRINIAHLVVVFAVALLVAEISLYKKQHLIGETTPAKKAKKASRSTARA